MGEVNFKSLEKRINYTFKNKDLLKSALTHKTFAFEADSPLEFNERLEFLGDSILGFIVAEQLYRSNKYFSEGELTRRRSTLVKNSFLAKRAVKFLRLRPAYSNHWDHFNISPSLLQKFFISQ